MGKLDSLLEEADNFKRRTRSCLTCGQPKVVLDAIELVAKKVLSGESEASLSWLHRQLKARFGFTLSLSALRNHLLNCRPDLWVAWSDA